MVEDSAMIVKRMSDLLNDIGGVTFVGNAQSISATLEILAKESPDAMILDINLGSSFEMNGIQLLHLIRKLYPILKVIMFTNLSNLHYRRQCFEAGADYFFDKSIDFDKLPEILAEISQQKKPTKT